MKARYLLMVVLVLLLAAPVAAAQEGWPTVCGYESRGHAPECFNGAAGVSAVSKPAGLAQPATAQEGWPNVPVQPLDPCIPSVGLDPRLCQSGDSAAKPAGLAQPAPVAEPHPGSSCAALTGSLFYEACISTYHGTSAAPKPAGLAAPAPAADPEQNSPCAALTGPRYESCKGTYYPTSGEAKPAGLAQLTPTSATDLGRPGCLWGTEYDPLANGYNGYVPACYWKPVIP